MGKGKLIVICQSGGEFLTNDDGSMSYTGGEAHAIEINCETVFDDLKLKIAELCNLEYRTLSIKYFLPGNKRTLITLANDKDLRRMFDFHANCVTADFFISGTEGFNREALNSNRPSELKVAESVIRNIASTPNTASKAANKETNHSPFMLGTSSNLSPVHSLGDDQGAHCSSPTGSIAVAADANFKSLMLTDMDSTPADTVKKRRRTASWTISANGPKIVAVSENVEDKRKTRSQKKNTKNQNIVLVAENVDHQQNITPCKGDSNCSSIVACSNDLPPEKLVASWKDSITGVGQEFKGVSEFRDVLQKYAIAHRFAYKLIKNDTNRATGICIADGCPWRIHASWVPSAHSFKIKSMYESHTCGGESWKSAHPTKNWLVSIIKDRLRDSPHHKPKDIANAILTDFGLELNYTQVWRGLEDAREQLQGSYREAYSQLPGFCKKMVEANPGSFVKLFTYDDKRFQHLFVSFRASLKGFETGCRPLLFLDSTSLKSKYQEDLLTATALDGDDSAFPVAFAIVDNENDDNWRWFLEQLSHVVATSQPLTFVSDREKGLKKPILEIFENAHHGYSIYHLLESFMRNLKGPFHGDGKASLPGSFMAAAHAVRLDVFKMSLEQIKRVSSEAHDWVVQIEPEYWTNALFKGENYNHIMLNVVESYTNWIDEMQELPIIQKAEGLSSKIMELINTRRIDSTRWSSKLTPLKEAKLQEESLSARGLKVLFSSDTLFEVHDDSINVVNIDKQECSCLVWKATGLPCRHAMAVFNCTSRNVYDYCSRYFTVDNCRGIYSDSINPVSSSFNPSSGEEAAEETETETVLPPCTSKLAKQHKKNQKKADVNRKTVTCSKCKEAGHNKVTCKATI
ncbi:Protein FAR1-RELATED SEQUENCE like [Quillaja saponaria]|uniref:Protein FAR1-RELATED SEQUENCE like n=1 Tax=Quillaja saponaria TaxID=32244 RepID=A0AAD7LH17_QUISA|nr:Protein FAR1-RELATED SEQUENCE like [Quillaja saponaria]